MKKLLIMLVFISGVSNAGVKGLLNSKSLKKHFKKNKDNYELVIEENFGLRLTIINKSIGCLAKKITKSADLVGVCLFTAVNQSKDYIFSSSMDDDGTATIVLLDQFVRPRM